MGVGIFGTVTGDREVALKITNLRSLLRARVITAVRKATIELQADVKGDALSGGVLKNVTGGLRRNVNQQVSDDGTSVTGKVGTNLVYGPPHEYGFSGTVTVREHLRRTVSKGQLAKLRKRGDTAVLSGYADVREHSMRMRLPERSYLRGTLAKNRAKYEGIIAEALK